MNPTEKPTITIRLRDQEYTIQGVSTVREALEILQIPPELFLVVRNGELLDGETPLSDGDFLQLVGAISGGSAK
ncbi:MoaD/ThiS family protein [Anaerolinea sp.]|uniref:MoaD/ThiS family protein n=1 Tax=Anaerolinea sp. TaxID=1872519 RepID=UPI002ACD2D9D|nr:MoaD/ThiS family protein [Anaerolinea sp.]